MSLYDITVLGLIGAGLVFLWLQLALHILRGFLALHRRPALVPVSRRGEVN